MSADFYLCRQEELAKFQRLRAAKGEPDDGTTLLDIFQLLAGNDKPVFQLLWAFYNATHAIDDIKDDCQSCDGEQLAELLHNAIAKELNYEHVDPSEDFQDFCGQHMVFAMWDDERVELATKAIQDFFKELAINPFVAENAPALQCVFAQTITRWLDGDAMAASSDPKRREWSTVVRCGDVDAICAIMYLRGGWKKLRQVSPLRDYDIELESEVA